MKKRFIVWLTINRQCNLECKWCYQGQLLHSAEVMSPDLAKTLIDISQEVGAQKFILLGGEPTVHPDFFQIAKMASVVETAILTNAIAFSSMDYCRRVEDTGINAVTTSLKGSSEEEYKSGCGKRVFSRVMQAIQNLEQSTLRHQVSVTMCRASIEKWAEFLVVIRESGANHFTFSFERPVVVGEKTMFDDSMLPANIVPFIEQEMYPSLKKIDVGFDLNLTFPQCHFSDGFVDMAHSEGHAVAGCQLLMDNGIIFDPSGRVLPCNHMVDHPLGEFGKDFFTPTEFGIWRDSPEIRRFYEVAGAPPGTQCKDCAEWRSCGAGCRVFWLHKNQDVLIPVSAIQKRRSNHG